MDWLSDKYFDLLEAEWDAILRRAAPDTRVIWRSGGLETDYIRRVRVQRNGQRRPLHEMLDYNQELADSLHKKCRVHTYGSFYIADLVTDNA